jgi:aspartate ammonia-lyase
MSADPNDILAGLIVEMGLADEETRDRLVAEARASGRPLIDVLVDHRYLTQQQRREILKASDVHRRKATQTLAVDREVLLATIIVDKGLVDAQTRDALVAQAKETGRPLLDILVENGFLTPREKEEILKSSAVRRASAAPRRGWDSERALAKLIVEKGLVDAPTRDRLVAQANREGKPLVDVLVENGLLTSADRDQILKASGVRRREQRP